MSSLKAFPAERKKERDKNPKPLRINKNQKNSPNNNKRKHTPTHKNNLACQQKSELQNKPRKTKIQQWVVSKGRIEEMVQKPLLQSSITRVKDTRTKQANTKAPKSAMGDQKALKPNIPNSPKTIVLTSEEEELVEAEESLVETLQP